MTLGDILTTAVCLLWVLVCGLRWWITPAGNKGQRRFFAIAAGLGAGLFWIIGQGLWQVIFTKPDAPGTIKSGAEIRIQPR